MERSLIGYVSVDSGLLAIVDPAYTDREVEIDEQPVSYGDVLPRDWADLRVGPEGRQLGSGGWGSAILVGTGVGDGIFPVYREDGKVIIDLQDWQWDAEDGKGRQPIGEVNLKLEGR